MTRNLFQELNEGFASRAEDRQGRHTLRTYGVEARPAPDVEGLIQGEMQIFESEDCLTELREQFWEEVLAYEKGEWTAHFDELTEAGMVLPAPEALDDAQLPAKLQELIHGLALLHCYLYNTDHLSDRELYEELWQEALREEGPRMPVDEDSAWHIDLVGSGSGEDTAIYLRYYADEEERRCWAGEWPDEPMPEHEKPPYDRDQHLPKRHQQNAQIKTLRPFDRYQP